MELPSKATFDRLQADPSLPERDAGVLEEFEAAPWLLPPRTKALRYTGVHDLDQLLQMQAAPVGNYNKTVSVVLFSKNVAIMAQNSIYSLIKFGGVRNYVVCTWSQTDLEACADLNLPCADISSMLAEPLVGPAPTEGVYTNGHDILVVKWLRPAVLAHLLKNGYAAHISDADTVYTTKPVHASYVKFLEYNQADMAMQDTDTPGGSYMYLPTPGAAQFAANWSAAAVDGIKEGKEEMDYKERWGEQSYLRCHNKGCIDHAVENTAPKFREEGREVALLRTYLPGHHMMSEDGCFMTRPNAPLIDVCDWAVLHVHPSCATFDQKKPAFQAQGLWFTDEYNCAPQSGAASQVPACQPLRWREPATENLMYSCPQYDLGLIHERAVPPPPPPPQQENSTALAEEGGQQGTARRRRG